MLQPIVRSATDACLPAIAEIYNAAITTSTAVFSEVPVTLDERRAWLQQRTAAGYPVLVAELEARVLGFATFGAFRAWPGYRFTVEHSVYVHNSARGKGLGTQLMRALFVEGQSRGLRVMVAGIDAANAGSVRFHERLGFTRCGVLPGVGHKFGRFLDLAFLCKSLE